MQAWWLECLGMESGALFMKRFMNTQTYSNYRYSDAIRCGHLLCYSAISYHVVGSSSCQTRPRGLTHAHISNPHSKRDVNRALGADAFSPKYRPLGLDSSHDDTSPPSCLKMAARTADLALSEEDLQEDELPPPGWEEEGPLPYQEPLLELFHMALTGGTAKPAVTESYSYEALVPLAKAGLLYRPCNGMCGGRCDTEDCTDMCLELWHHKCVRCDAMRWTG